MKLSVAWIFDHIDASWHTVDVAALVARCIQTTAEVEGFYPVTCDVSQLSLAQVSNKTDDRVMVISPEWQKTVELSKRNDAQLGQWYMIKRDGESQYQWASMHDFGGTKDHLLPALHAPECVRAGDLYAEAPGSWKKQFEMQDYILELDNKSITHRPDLWGHRGFAREVAVMLNVSFKELSNYVVDKKIVEHDTRVAAQAGNRFSITNEASRGCKRFAGLSINQIDYRPSSLWMMHRLCRVDSKPIDLIVDATNYVMFDIGQPMHAFDADQIATPTIGPRFARDKETLLLLDGANVTLSPHDVVIADSKQPLALAGIMGGAYAKVQNKTQSLFVEAGCFDATTIRLSSARHKVRTESSARFEKSLDPHQPTVAIMRWLKLMRNESVLFDAADAIMACGTLAQQPVITVAHDFIERRLGVKIDPAFVMGTLSQLAFTVETNSAGEYVITVPTFRATKDVNIKEDIVEEIGRYYGYSVIEHVVPHITSEPSDLTPIMRVRTLRHIMAYALQMRELYNYAFFDEEFLQEIKWQPEHTVSVQNPVSEHWRRLVTTLTPMMLRAIKNNVADYPTLRFFEWARTWHKKDNVITEKKVLAGIIFEQKTPIDFYMGKALIQRLFDALHIAVTWQRVDKPEQPWLRHYQTADIMHGDKVIGRVGMSDQLFLHAIAEGDAFIFELDGDFLLNYNQPVVRYVAGSKYPEVVRDISVLIALKYTAHDLIARINALDERIVKTTLVDFFEKAEWIDQRSLTFRLVVQDAHKTLTKEEVDAIIDCVSNSLQALGAIIR